MKSLSNLNKTVEDLSFIFETTYMGKEITLNVIANNDKFSVIHDHKTIGHIKLGEIRHTWYVVDSNYTPPYLVDEIGNKIEECLSVLN